MTASAKPLKAPFPYPGGKSRVADLVWDRLGDVANYVEPFAGTLAVLLRRPAEHFRDGYRVETCNDLNHYLVNFWRAVKADPEAVAGYADWPVTEADLHARHRWLVRSKESAEFRERMRADPEAFDAKIAGWWVWGQCCWIGAGWCMNNPAIATPETEGRPARTEAVVNARLGSVGRVQIPELASGVGRGLTAAHTGGRPQLADAFDIGRGVNGGGSVGWTQIPVLNAKAGGVAARMNLLGTCDARRAWLRDWIGRLADRLRLVRTCYGHWARVCDSDSTLTRLGTTGVFLDPPYPAVRSDTGAKSRDDNLYANDKSQCLDALRDEVLSWCLKWGINPAIRVAVCGYEGDGYEPLTREGWAEVSWEASGGYANQRRKGGGKAANARRERIWFSPACLTPAAGKSLFDDV